MPPENPLQKSILYDPYKVERRRCFLINLLYFAVIVGAAVLAVRYLLLWMLPFVLGFIIASLLQKPLKWLVNKTRFSKKFYSVVLVVLFILLFAGVIFIISWQIVNGIISFVTDKNNIIMIENTVLGVSNGIQNLIVRFSNVFPDESLSSVQEAVSNSASDFSSYLSGLFTDATAGIVSFTTTDLPMLLVSFIIWVIASIFLTIDYNKVTSFLMRQVPSRHAEMVEITRELCTNTIFKLLRAYLLLMFITFVELSISFCLLKIPYFLLVAALIAIVDILPVLGTGTILIPWAFISLLTGNPVLFIGLGLTYIVVTVIRNILEPRLVSRQIGLNPLVTLFFMFLGLKAIGLFGMLLFPVIVMVLTQLQKSGKIKLWK